MANIIYKEFLSFFKKQHTLPLLFKKCEQRIEKTYLELHDVNKKLTISTSKNDYSSKISNPNSYNLLVFDYDKFLTLMPTSLQEGLDRCDAIIYTLNNKEYFILNELKDRDNSDKNKRKKIRTKAKSQLIDTLELLVSVPGINSFINSFTHKICVSSNAQPYSTTSSIISNTLNSFNQGRNLPNGSNLLLQNTKINNLGFKYYDIFGDKTFDLS